MLKLSAADKINSVILFFFIESLAKLLRSSCFNYRETYHVDGYRDYYKGVRNDIRFGDLGYVWYVSCTDNPFSPFFRMHGCRKDYR